MKTILLILALISSFASASDYVYLGSWSHHLNEHPNSGWKTIEPDADHPCWKKNICITGEQYVEEKFNETHNLIAYQKDGYMVGHFKNSYNQSTVVVTRNFQYDYKDLGFILAVGADHGYSDCDEREKPGSARVCFHYQGGIAYTKYKIEPVLSLSGTVVNFSFRIKI